MSCWPFNRRGILAVLAAALLALVAGCPPATQPGSSTRPAAPDGSKPAKETGSTSRVTPPEHIPGS
jgi:hypothetical protein